MHCYNYKYYSTCAYVVWSRTELLSKLTWFCVKGFSRSIVALFANVDIQFVNGAEILISLCKHPSRLAVSGPYRDIKELLCPWSRFYQFSREPLATAACNAYLALFQLGLISRLVRCSPNFDNLTHARNITSKCNKASFPRNVVMLRMSHFVFLFAFNASLPSRCWNTFLFVSIAILVYWRCLAY
jgi:hypothetical protein